MLTQATVEEISAALGHIACVAYGLCPGSIFGYSVDSLVRDVDRQLRRGHAAMDALRRIVDTCNRKPTPDWVEPDPDAVVDEIRQYIEALQASLEIACACAGITPECANCSESTVTPLGFGDPCELWCHQCGRRWTTRNPEELARVWFAAGVMAAKSHQAEPQRRRIRFWLNTTIRRFRNGLRRRIAGEVTHQ